MDFDPRDHSDHLQTGRDRIEFVVLTRQHLQLSQLVGVA
jgi:hypothetical protein